MHCGRIYLSPSALYLSPSLAAISLSASPAEVRYTFYWSLQCCDPLFNPIVDFLMAKPISLTKAPFGLSGEYPILSHVSCLYSVFFIISKHHFPQPLTASSTLEVLGDLVMFDVCEISLVRDALLFLHFLLTVCPPLRKGLSWRSPFLMFPKGQGHQEYHHLRPHCKFLS